VFCQFWREAIKKEISPKLVIMDIGLKGDMEVQAAETI